MPTTAPAVSAFIKRNTGYTPVPRTREGVHVTRSRNGACVTIDIDAPAAANRAYAEVVTALRQQGYTVRLAADALILYVTHEGA